MHSTFVVDLYHAQYVSGRFISSQYVGGRFISRTVCLW